MMRKAMKEDLPNELSADSAPYLPIQCGLHDQLESLATLREPCEVFHDDAEASAESSTSGMIVDVFARSGAEYVQMDNGEEIRLDRIRSVGTARGNISFRG